MAPARFQGFAAGLLAGALAACVCVAPVVLISDHATSLALDTVRFLPTFLIPSAGLVPQKRKRAETQSPYMAAVQSGTAAGPELITLGNLAPAPGSKKRKRRVARGIAGKGGATGGRGIKDHKNNGKRNPWWIRQIPKYGGFRNPNQVEYRAVNLDKLDKTGLDEIDIKTMHELGLLSQRERVKILGGGNITRPIKVLADAFSASAVEAITAAGGSVQVPDAMRPTYNRKPMNYVAARFSD